MDYSEIIGLIRDVIADPGANVTQTVLLLAFATLLLLILDLVVLLVISPRTRRVKKVVRRWIPANAATEVATGDKVEGFDEPVPVVTEEDAKPAAGKAKRPGRALTATAATALIWILLLLSAVGGYTITGTDTVCGGTCHADDKALIDYSVDDHAERATCVACHERGRGTGVLGAVTARARMGLAQLGLSDEPGAAGAVQSSACLRCHDITGGVIKARRANIRMDHSHPLEAGWNCIDCHGPVGHLGEGGRRRVSMDECMLCHNGLEVDAKCTTCHTTDVAATGPDSVLNTLSITGSGRYHYPPVNAANRDCGGCHEQEKQCDPCHTTRMPHPDRFVSGYHAKESAFEKKSACWRCHTEIDCQACHSPFDTGHPANWKSGHQSSEWDAGCGCHGRGTNVDIPICVFCHDDAPAQVVGPEHR